MEIEENWNSLMMKTLIFQLVLLPSKSSIFLWSFEIVCFDIKHIILPNAFDSCSLVILAPRHLSTFVRLPISPFSMVFWTQRYTQQLRCIVPLPKGALSSSFREQIQKIGSYSFQSSQCSELMMEGRCQS